MRTWLSSGFIAGATLALVENLFAVLTGFNVSRVLLIATVLADVVVMLVVAGALGTVERAAR